MKELRIWWLKRRLRAAYRTYHAELDSMSCGAALGINMNPRAFAALQRCNQTLGQLAVLDPDNCPITRLA